MNALRDTYDGDFEILAVPSSNFFNVSYVLFNQNTPKQIICFQQEPSGNGDEIMNAIRHVRPGNNFEPSFQVFGRSDVNGAARLDLYTWALHLCDSPSPTFFDPKMLYYDPISMEDVRWNFEKVSSAYKLQNKCQTKLIVCI